MTDKQCDSGVAGETNEITRALISEALKASSHQSRAKMRDVGEVDERWITDDTRRYPTNTVCRLTIPGTMLIASAVAVAPKLLVTAAHNLRSRHSESHWHVAPGYNEGHIYAQNFGVKEVAYPQYSEGHDPQFDIGVLTVKSELSSFIKPIFLHRLEGLGVTTIGYSETNYSWQWWHAGLIQASYGNLIAHSCDTQDGQSGAPLFSKAEGEWRLIGIHIGGYSYARTGMPLNTNKAIRFTDKIIGWINEQISRYS